VGMYLMEIKEDINKKSKKGIDVKVNNPILMYGE
jgi:hypothetical protein